MPHTIPGFAPPPLSPPKVVGSEAQTAELVEWLADQMRAEEVLLRRTPETAYAANWVYDNVIYQLGGPAPPKGTNRTALELAVGRLPRDVANHVLINAQVVSARLLWKRAKVTYPLDVSMWEELGEMSLDDRLPAGLFTKLPHPDPFICFPEPLVIPLRDGDVQRIVGVFVHGRRSAVEADGELLRYAPSSFCSTSDPRCVGLTLSFAGLVESKGGGPIAESSSGLRDIVWTHTSLDMRDGGTFGELVEGALERYSTKVIYSIGGTDVIELLIRRAVGVLLYLCCENADLRPLPARPPSSRKGRGKGKEKSPKLIALGYRVGAMLRAYRKRLASGGVGDGSTREPHVRRAHIHTYLRGKGRSERFLRWLHPILVNFGTDQDAELTTVVPLKRS